MNICNPVYAACLLNSEEILIGDGNKISIINILYENKNLIVDNSPRCARINAVCRLSSNSFASGDIEGNIYIWKIEIN